jgi:hypothetical protein
VRGEVRQVGAGRDNVASTILRAEVRARLARYERHILRVLGEENPDPEGSGVFHQQVPLLF